MLLYWPCYNLLMAVYHFCMCDWLGRRIEEGLSLFEKKYLTIYPGYFDFMNVTQNTYIHVSLGMFTLVMLHGHPVSICRVLSAHGHSNCCRA